MTKTDAVADKEILKLTDWEVANLHLPPVTTVTLYEDVAPVKFLRSRIAKILRKNPWITSRIVKKSTENGVVAMTYAKTFDVESTIDKQKAKAAFADTGTRWIDYFCLEQCSSISTPHW